MSSILSTAFVDRYRKKKPPFGFNGLGELTYLRTYSRIKENGKNETWVDTCERVVNGTFNMQKTWIDERQLGWDNRKGKKSAQEMFDRMFNMKFLPPGRGLWAMGSKLTEEKKIFASLNNCAYVSTASLAQDMAKPFAFLMDMSMLGVGVGFDLKGAGAIMIKETKKKRGEQLFTIEDTRESWVESIVVLLESYFHGTSPVVYDYSLVRAEGLPIKGFGGVSSGPKPLMVLHTNLTKVLDKNVGEEITETTIADIMNMIGVCVIAGNVRRTAEIMFGDNDSEEFIDLKNYEKNPERASYGWTSNNSIFAELGMQYNDVAQRTKNNGEPGYIWLDNMRDYGRMCEPANYKDKRVVGANPCCEQSLESYELCCLVETFPANHDSLEDYKRTLKFAYLYAKTVTLGQTHWAETNRVLLRNRRIGCSMSGITQYIGKHGMGAFKTLCEEGYSTIQQYDKAYSEWFATCRSVKTTSIKPSGTVSLLAGATPGMHWAESRYYIRRVRVSIYSDLLKPLEKAGYHIEPDKNSPKTTMVVEFPIDIGANVRLLSDVSIWEQLSMASFIQRYWADNQVSCTVTFDPETEGEQITQALDYFQYGLKGISFLPKLKAGAYAQMPYEEITQNKFKKMSKDIKKLRFGVIKGEEADVEKFCDGGSCQILP